METVWKETESIIHLDIYILVNEPDKTDENYKRLWKMRAIIDKPNDSYAKNYSLTKH
jgi:hypothetical protein